MCLDRSIVERRVFLFLLGYEEIYTYDVRKEKKFKFRPRRLVLTHECLVLHSHGQEAEEKTSLERKLFS